ncbi:DUF2750 domain-containing protein [Marinomonas ostreistagni]|nr:DUF2750 domain-containing protein [Marinomonas ostreistagni]
MTMSNTDFFRETSQSRYDLFVKHLSKGGVCFTLADEEGCLNLTVGNERVLPIWPTAELANEWASAEHQEFSALEISNEAFVETWLPGMQNDNISVGVAPNMAGEGIVVQAMELKQEIQS